MSGYEYLIKALFVVLIIAAVVQLGVYWIIYRRLAFYRRVDVNKSANPVSVIVCARNEAINLRMNLPSVLEQDYPSFEVIVVNDCSWDETDSVLEELSKEYSKLKIVTIKEQEKYRHGKKFALTLGIKAATNDCLILTDADCKASGRNWLSLMQNKFSADKEIVLGYGAYSHEAGFLNKLIRFDTLYIAMQYLSAALGGNAYMGVGRNLGYRKSMFFRSKGFAKHNHILSGDDDLFVNENADRKNTAIEISPDAFTYSEAKKSFGEWFSQKKRHMGTAKYYKSGHKFSLLLQNSSTFFFYVSLIILLILRFEYRLLLSLYAFLLLIRLPVIYRVSEKLKEKDLLWAFPVFDIIHSFLQPVFYTANLITKQKTWK